MGAKFDGIYTGFVASEEQIRQIFQFLDTFHHDGSFLLVDPVMGDDGIHYDMFTDTLLSLMKELVFRAEIITPNVTELCLLTDTDYGHITGIKQPSLLSGKNGYNKPLLKEIAILAQSLCRQQIKHVVVTGIRFTDKDGIQKMGNLYATENSYEMFSFPYVGGSYSGTGDLFASCLCAGIARGDDIPSIIQTAGTFIELALSDSVKERIDRNDGVNYEKYLSLLIPKTSD